MNSSSLPTVKVLGIDFVMADAIDVANVTLGQGGLVTAPAAPALVAFESDAEYQAALVASTHVIADSGYMVALANIIKRARMSKLSGHALFGVLATEAVERSLTIFLVNPSEHEDKLNADYFRRLGLSENKLHSYIAPKYPKSGIEDRRLLDEINSSRCDCIFINIGGGTQEKLGAYIRKNIDQRIAVYCLGAAIAFRTGAQANIPDWADKFYLGWLFRCMHNPRAYISRYIKAFPLFYLILRDTSGR